MLNRAHIFSRDSWVFKIIGDLFLLLCALLTLDVVYVMLPRLFAVVRREIYIKILICELILCAIMVLYALDIRFDLCGRLGRRTRKLWGTIVRLTLTLLAWAIMVMGIKTSIAGRIDTAAPAPYALVLGMALENGEPTRDLLYRVDAAEAYYKQNPDAILILSGGNAEDGQTEAQIMGALLAARGISDDHWILDNTAVDTGDNFSAAARLINPEKTLVIITSDYHMSRAVRQARRAGFTHPLQKPSSSDPTSYHANIMWEIVMEIHDFVVSH